MKSKLLFLVLTLFSCGVIFFVGSSFSIGSADSAPTGCEGNDCPDLLNPIDPLVMVHMHTDGLDEPPYYKCCSEQADAPGKMMVNNQNPD